MLKQEAIDFYGGSVTALADKLGCTAGAISQWGDYPPDARQLQLQKITRGKLKAEPGCRQRLLAPRIAEKARA